ncbi:Crp/Fnr family transcriptional regulator [Dyadobacter sp. BHUBP1]|uniref:Crp/Fnr family transcriptional regulator n=1 Tax=Dyadobacter sp. BHUBP1 TaxID=3424178 RepID=UPI003D33DBFF
MASQSGLPGETIRHISGLATVRRLHKNEALLTAGEICRHKVFIASGLLRTYHIKPDGNEHILHFSPQHTWTLDVESYDKQAPSLVNIEAVERSEVLLWAKPDFDKWREISRNSKRFRNGSFPVRSITTAIVS